MSSRHDPKEDAGRLRFAETCLQAVLEKKTGLALKITTFPLDTLAQAVQEKGIDFAILPGADYEWVRRLHPNLKVLAFANQAAASREVRPTVAASVVVTKGRGLRSVADLRGKVLGSSSSRYHSLFFLHRLIHEAGFEPAGFFRHPAQSRLQDEEALQDVADGSVDVVVVDDDALDQFRRRHPEGWDRLAILARSVLPAPMVIANSDRAGGETVRKMVQGLTRETGSTSFDLYQTLTRKVYGIEQFSEPTAEYRRGLELLQKSLVDYPEYFLPISFY